MSTPQTPPFSTHEVADDILNQINSDFCNDLMRIRRPLTGVDAKRVYGFLQSLNFPMVHVPSFDSLEQSLSSTCVEYDGFQPVFIFVEERNGNDADGWHVCSLAQWSFGYSTWKGRVMNLNTFLPGKYESILMKILVTIAKELDCKRLVHQTTTKPLADLFCRLHDAEELPEWLTLELGTSGMTALLSNTEFHQESPPPSHENKSHPPCIKSALNTGDIIREVLGTANSALTNETEGSAKSIRLRVANENDADHVLNLVKGLAVFEKAAEEVIVTSDIYKRDGCGIIHPIFHCILVESLNAETNLSHVVGMGLFYFGYSALHGGRYLFLEDLFIEKEYRGLGCGTCIMSSLADIAIKTGCFRFVWQVLEWNMPAIQFYKHIGATVCSDLSTLRLNYEQIDNMTQHLDK